MANDELKTIKFQMMLSESEARALDDWGFANRIKSRAEVIRRLCQIGLVLTDESEAIGKNQNEAIDRLIAFLEQYAEASEEPESIYDIGAVEAVEAITFASVHISGLLEMIQALRKGDDLEGALEAAGDARRKVSEKLKEIAEGFKEYR